jgi:hypothetical protein
MVKTNNWVAYVCKDCHSDNIYFDALAEWDVETQQFNVILNENKQGAECRDCSGSGAIAVDIPSRPVEPAKATEGGA